jgi:hypothetical protein
LFDRGGAVVSAQVETGWVVPPPPIRGLDHLGVQAPCVALYGQLLPGITNVTDRARYYSFYPWLIWSYEKRYSDRSRDAFCRVLRRAECLFGLVAAYHETLLEADEGDHGVATVGRIKLRGRGADALEGTVLDLDEYAALDSENRYFKNSLGGLGQYYFGPLRDLKILDYVDNDRKKPPGYDHKRGVWLAMLFDSSVDADRFFDVLESGRVGEAELADLVAFCPCGLRSNEPEHGALLDIFLARTDAWQRDGGIERRVSLALLLDLVDRTPDSPDVGLEDLLRGAAYSRTLVGGEAWVVSEAWHRVRDGWGVYARNELLSIALQGLFWAQMRAIEDRGGTIRSVEDAARLVRDVALAGLGPTWSGLSVARGLARLRDELPPIEAWVDDDHEIRRAWSVVHAAQPGADVSNVARESALLLMSLLVRGLREHPYQEFDLDPAYFAPGDIHLVTLRRWAREWESWRIEDWLEWLGRRWCIERHLHVALRKLRAENRDTFRIRPLDGELTVVEVPPVVFTSPRITRAEQILRDLGLLAHTDEWWTLSADGRRAVETCRG